jgi:hypothetical protein
MIIFTAASENGFCKVEVHEYTDGWRIVSLLNNSSRANMPFPKFTDASCLYTTGNSADLCVKKAKDLVAIFNAKGITIEPVEAETEAEAEAEGDGDGITLEEAVQLNNHCFACKSHNPDADCEHCKL